MEFSWTTFILEAINFVALVWILKRILYRPILNAVRERRRKIEESLSRAETSQREAAELQKTYDNRLREWEREKEEKRKALKADMDAERSRGLEALQRDLEKEREKKEAVETKRRGDQIRKDQEEALALGAAFAARLLERVAGPETEEKIVACFLEDLKKLTEEEIRKMKSDSGGAGEAAVEIRSAFALSAAQKAKIENALRPLFADKAPLRFTQDPSLTAGLSVSTGSLILKANLKDELSFFAEAKRDGD